MDQLAEGIFKKATELYRRWRSPRQAETTSIPEPAANLEGLRYGGFTLSSPKHP